MILSEKKSTTKTVYIKQNGKRVNAEVSGELCEETKRLRRAEWRNDANFKNRYFSLEERMEQGCDIVDDSQNPEIWLFGHANDKQKAARLKKLKAALKTLTEKQSTAIHKHFFLRMSYAEIASEEGVSKQSIDERIQGALKKLRKFF